jgi:predicted TIM-barrel fold metal-dependent hydrolase
MRRTFLCASAACLVGAVSGAQQPQVDYHQHFFSPAAAKLVSTPTTTIAPITASEVVALLDAAGIRRALVLSVAYTWGSANRVVEDEYAKVKAENDYTSREVARFPDRLRGFCGVNPLKDYALEELARCAKDPQLHYGLKLHFGNSDVQVHEPKDVERLRRVFRAANGYGMSIVVHMHASISKERPYGAQEARIFLDSILPSAPDVYVQIAHLAGGGPHDDSTDAALGVFAAAVEKRDPRVRRVTYDVTPIVLKDMTPEQVARLVARIRQLGPERVLYGTDAATPQNLSPKDSWELFRRLPLTEAEFKQIASNVTPYMRW